MKKNKSDKLRVTSDAFKSLNFKSLNFKLLILLSAFCFLLSASVFAQEKKPKGEPINIYYEEEENWKDITWKRNGFEFYIGAGVYGGMYFPNKKKGINKQTANYYNGAPENNINLNLIYNNKEFYWKTVQDILHEKYPHGDVSTVKLIDDYNYDSRYNIAMDISLGGKYRFKNNWYIELSYSFRRVSCENRFSFEFPNGVPGNKENPKYTGWQHLLAKEDRHYIDFSIGYIFHVHRIVKPFISIGGLFTYISLKSFNVFIESNKPTFDLMALAKDPYYNGITSMPNYKVWAGPGYGASFTFGLKLAVNRMVSLDPVFQLSIASFGNSRNLPGFNTDMCFNYMAGVRLVMNDAIFTRNKY
jgi:opacity protein-like surface antigen